MKLYKFCSLCFVLASLSAIAFANKPNQPSNLSITTVLESNDLSGAVASIQSDSLGPYHDGVDAVTSFLTTNGYNHLVWGDWQFGTLNSTTRKVSVGFTNPIPVVNGGTATPNPPFTTKAVIAHIEDQCTMISYSMITMIAGQSFPCPALAHFYDSNTYEYRIYFEPNRVQPTTPETTFIQVTCNTVATDGSGCNDWYLDPIPTHDASGNPMPGQAIGRLEFNGCSSCPKGKGQTTTPSNLGDYYFRFHFHLTRPNS
jgi:hypothetical protein